MPTLSCQDILQYQPGAFLHYPTFIVEIAVKDEHRGRLLADADLKYFYVNTTNHAWLGVKVDHAQNTFWAGWGRRAHVGNGLRLMGLVENAKGIATCQSILALQPLLGPNFRSRQPSFYIQIMYHLSPTLSSR